MFLGPFRQVFGWCLQLWEATAAGWGILFIFTRALSPGVHNRTPGGSRCPIDLYRPQKKTLCFFINPPERCQGKYWKKRGEKAVGGKGKTLKAICVFLEGEINTKTRSRLGRKWGALQGRLW